MSTPDVTVRFGGVSKRYRRDIWGLRDVSFAFHPGEVVGLMGPNGAGKSTALALACGLLQPTTGEVTTLGEPVGRTTRTPAHVGVVVEQPRFVGTLTARTNLRLLASLSPVADADDIDATLGEVGLGDVVNRRVGGFSVGMRQRLAIAQALIERPRVLLLDEPTNGLDPVGVRYVRDLLAERARQGTTVVIASHALTELETLCDTTLLIDQGRIRDRIDAVDRGLIGVHLLVGRADHDRVAATVAAIHSTESRHGLLEIVVGPEPIPGLVARLVAAGVDVHGVSALHPTLESRYLGAVERA